MNQNINNNRFQQEEEEIDLKEIIKKIRLNLIPIVIISLIGTVLAVYYAFQQPDIYKSSSLIRISKGSSNILEGPLIAEFGVGKNEHVENEIEIMKIYSIRENVADKLIEKYHSDDHSKFYLIKKRDFSNDDLDSLKSRYEIIEMLAKQVSISQKNDLEIVEVSIESPSPYEASLIANLYVESYKEMNLKNNRQQLTTVKEFLKEQVDSKFKELVDAEYKLSEYQQDGGIVALDEQANQIITRLSDFEARKQSLQLDMAISSKNLSLLKKELAEKEPRLAGYIEDFHTEQYVEELLTEIAKFEVNRDIAISGKDGRSSNAAVIDGYNKKIAELRTKVDAKIEQFQNGVFNSTKEEIKELLARILQEDIKYQTLQASANELSGIVRSYEDKFNELPKQAFEYARLERDRSVKEKLYLLVEEKFQEALVNEQAVPSNVIVLDEGRIPVKPSGPNRIKIILIGIMLGLGLSFGFVFIKEFLNNKIQSPEEVQKMGLRVLGWIPRIPMEERDDSIQKELIVKNRNSSTHAESFRSIRARLQIMDNGSKKMQSILISSTAPQEGKTFFSSNISASFAFAGNKTILVDADLRKPRVHKLFGIKRVPGVTDYIMGTATIDEIIRPTGVENLYVMTAGNIPSNPSEMLGSIEMTAMLDLLKEKFDKVIVDSPPIIAVSDAEILSDRVSGLILVARADKTERETLKKAAELVGHEHTHFIGTVVNDFVMRKEYGAYYKYYYYYSHDNKPGDKVSNIHTN